MRIKTTAGFSLFELLVVIAVISILAGVMYISYKESTEQSRDTQRKADLRSLQSAVELYKQDVGRYPMQCEVAGQMWSGQLGTDFECDDGTGEYIRGLAPKYIKSLPKDPKLNGTFSGYAYIVNTSGTVYKLMALNTVESETLNSYSQDYEFKACDIELDSSDGDIWVDCDNTNIPNEWSGTSECALRTCNAYNVAGNTFWMPPRYSATRPGSENYSCELGNIESTYAVWGGYATSALKPFSESDPNVEVNYAKDVEKGTEKIVCAMPHIF